MEYQGIKISQNWDCIIPFPKMVEDARFIFSHKSYGGERIKIVVKEPVEQMNCFEIGYDRYGILVKADTIFNDGWGAAIQDSSKEIVKYIKEYLIKDGATDLICNSSY